MGLILFLRTVLNKVTFAYVYRKSMIDAYFYKECGATANSAVIKK